MSNSEHSGSARTRNAELFFKRPRIDVYGAQDDGAESASLNATEIATNTLSTLYILLMVGESRYALEASSINTVMDSVRVHPIPGDSGGALQGLINFRGRVIPAISIAALLGVDGEAGLRAVIVYSSRGPIALLVQSTLGALRIEEQRIASLTLSLLVRGSVLQDGKTVSVLSTSALQTKMEAVLW